MRRSELAARRRARGHTQETLAHRLGVNVSSVARWERGLATPYPQVRRALAEELNLPLDALAAMLGPATDARLSAVPPDEWNWLTARIRDNHRPTVGHDSIARIRARTRYLRTADDVVAGGDLHQTIQKELAFTSGLLSTARHTDQIRRQLLASVAELCQLCGWSTADAGDPSLAGNYYQSGIAAARAAALPELEAEIASGFAYHLVENDGDATEAVLVAHSARARLEQLASPTPSMLAMVHARLAWALTAAGEPQRAHEAMDQAREHFATRDVVQHDPDWLYWLSESAMDIIIGRFDAAAKRTASAQRRLRISLTRCDPRHVREYTLYTTWLAHTYLDVGDTGEAELLAQRCRDLDASIDSSFSRRAVQGLTAQLAALLQVMATL